VCEFVRVELEYFAVRFVPRPYIEGIMMLTAGLMNPTGLFRAAMRASLTAAITDAKMGAEADVPPE
jgi:hypothetical protein